MSENTAGIYIDNGEEHKNEVEPMPLAALSGAVLTWEDTDGNTHEVHFES